jgi:hypothetical protein
MPRRPCWICRSRVLGRLLRCIEWKSNRSDYCGMYYYFCTFAFVTVSPNHSSSAAIKNYIWSVSPQCFTVLFCTLTRYKPNGVVVALSLCFSAINIACIIIDWFVFTPFLVYVTLFYGVFIGWFSVSFTCYDYFVLKTCLNIG